MQPEMDALVQDVVVGDDGDGDWLLLDAQGYCLGRIRWDGVRAWAPPPGIAQVVRAGTVPERYRPAGDEAG